MRIKGLKFMKTCFAFPEQYNVYDENLHIVGYVRLRWGRLYCEYPDVCGEKIYIVDFDDETQGSFENDTQRQFYLNAIADRILERMKR